MIEEDVTLLESEIKELEEYVHSHENREKEVTSLLSIASEMKTLEQNLSCWKDDAEDMRINATSNEGIHSWSPLSLKQSEIRLQFQNYIKDAQTQLVFSFNNDYIRCQAIALGDSTRDALNPHNFLYKYVSTRLGLICKSLQSKLDSSEEICQVVQEFEWKLKRLDLIQKELLQLSSRHDSHLSLEPGKEGNFFVCNVIFSNKCGTKRIRSAFEIGDAYPFTPMELSIELLRGEININDLSRQLIDSTRPGYAYLSRACDVLSTFISTEK